MRVKKRQEVRIYTKGRQTKIMFGMTKPYPKRIVIKRIIQLFDYLMEQYQKVKIDLLCDSASVNEHLDEFTHAQYQYDIERKEGPGIIIFNSEWLNYLYHGNMLGKHGIPDDLRMKSWNLDKIEHKEHLQYILLHEFAHAIETQYSMNENKTIKNAYKEYISKNDFKGDISEFIVNCFVTSQVAANNEMANRIKKVMDLDIKRKTRG